MMNEGPTKDMEQGTTITASRIWGFGWFVVRMGPIRLVNVNTWSRHVYIGRLNLAILTCGHSGMHCAEIDHITAIAGSQFGRLPYRGTTIQPGKRNWDQFTTGTGGLRGQCSVGINCLTGELCFGRELRRLTSAEHKIKYGIDEGRRED